MRAINEAYDGAGRFREFMDKLANTKEEPTPPPRTTGENRAQRRAREQQERRERKRLAKAQP